MAACNSNMTSTGSSKNVCDRGKMGGNKKVKVFREKEKRWIKDRSEIQQLEEQCLETANTSVITRFLDLPISKRTFMGLKRAGYENLTEIQRESIPLALKGLDILGAAKTGSGKTLAFLIPVLEKLYRNEWTHLDGLGALIITPVRELAYQIFEVLKKIGKMHDFSAGLIIGGKDLKFERNRLKSCSIIIGTPGRLLQHMDENPLLDCSTLKVLVLDEADRILDMGFATTMNAIIENLPTERQTLLFSATQTRSVKDLARLSLKDPIYVSVHEHSKHSTPEALLQSYIVCELHEKMDLLWSFIKHHLKQKILVFMTSCKQVKYTYEALCRLRPGMSVMALYGSLHQLKRMAIYNDFCNKTSVVLIATDLAARGLDFPAVNWVVQLDCPDDVNTYIHRAGRTARYEADGEALLILLPSEEEGMVAHLEQKKIPIRKIKVNPSKQHSIQRKLEALLARDVTLKESAQRAFVSYVKSVFLMKDKKVFDVTKLNTAAYANSLGLAIPPRIRFLQRHEKKAEQDKIKKCNAINNVETVEQNDSSNKLSSNTKNRELSNKEPAKLQPTLNFGHHADSESDDDLFTVKRKVLPSDVLTDEDDDNALLMEIGHKSLKHVTKAALARKILKKNIKPNNKVIFDDDGKIKEDKPKQQMSEIARDTDNVEGGLNIEKARLIMQEEDKIDKQLYRQRIKTLHKEKRLKEKEQRNRHKAQNIKKDEEENALSSDEAASVDLDFLPDPDKVYQNLDADTGNEESESHTNDESDSEDSSSGTEDARKNKRKKMFTSPTVDSDTESSSEDSGSITENALKNKRKAIRSDVVTANKKLCTEIAPLDTGLSLKDDEELVLHLLSKS